MAIEPQARTEPTDAVELLVAQHRRIEPHLAALAEEAAPAQRRERLQRAGDELAVHIAAEELVFYPAVRAERTEDILLESLEEHLSLKRLLADLLALAPDDATFTPKCKVLREQVEHHHREEEEHLFPKVNKLLTAERRRDLGARMQQQQALLRQVGRPRELAAGQTDAAESLDPQPPSATPATVPRLAGAADTPPPEMPPAPAPAPGPLTDPLPPDIGDPQRPGIGDPEPPDVSDPPMRGARPAGGLPTA